MRQYFFFPPRTTHGVLCSNIVEYCFRNSLPRFCSLHGVKFQRFLSFYPDFPVFRKLLAILDTISHFVNIQCPIGCVALQQQRRFRITFAASLHRNVLTWRERGKKMGGRAAKGLAFVGTYRGLVHIEKRGKTRLGLISVACQVNGDIAK